jgi:hypothetical protein
MTARKTPKLDQLAALEEQVAAARARADETKERARHAEAEAAHVTEALTEAFSVNDTTAIARLTKAKATAETKAHEPWPERIAGAQRAAQRAEVERDAWRVEHHRELLHEVAADADAAAASLTAKIGELEAARRDWHAVAHRVAALVVGVPGFDPRAVPHIDAHDGAIRDLRRCGPIPAPIPGATAAATVIPEDHPDPTVREAARQKVREAR